MAGPWLRQGTRLFLPRLQDDLVQAVHSIKVQPLAEMHEAGRVDRVVCGLSVVTTQCYLTPLRKYYKCIKLNNT